MCSRILTGSALALAVLALGSTGAAACDWDDCDACGGYGSYAATAYYGYHARPAYAYAPAVYYAPPAYAYYAPAYYAPAPAYYAPPAYGYPYARPYYGGRGGYVDAAGDSRHKGPIPAAIPTARGMYASGGNPGQRTTKAPNPNYGTRAVVAAAAKIPNQRYGARGVAAAAADRIKPVSNVPVAPSYGAQGRYVPTAYYGGPEGYVGPRR
jgi:hypothetical protein